MLYIMRHGKTDWNAKHKLQAVSYTHLDVYKRQVLNRLICTDTSEWMKMFNSNSRDFVYSAQNNYCLLYTSQ